MQQIPMQAMQMTPAPMPQMHAMQQVQTQAQPIMMMQQPMQMQGCQSQKTVHHAHGGAHAGHSSSFKSSGANMMSGSFERGSMNGGRVTMSTGGHAGHMRPHSASRKLIVGSNLKQNYNVYKWGANRHQADPQGPVN